jgi:alcohol-forming fatty acyl-CoA reductase
MVDKMAVPDVSSPKNLQSPAPGSVLTASSAATLPAIAVALNDVLIGVTGATGFLGTALVERLLRGVPGCELALVVRSSRRTSAVERVRREILRNDCFDRLRTDLGDTFEAEMERRVLQHVIDGDVSKDGMGMSAEGLAILSRCHTVIHSAAAVAFDSPLDYAVETNLMGPTRLAEAMRTAGCTGHLVAVSTCYVAGKRRGPSPERVLSETPFSPDLDWRAEVAGARRMRADIDATSRTTKQLEEFRKLARRELGAAGEPLLAAKTEKLRDEWVRDELVAAGIARASSLGWPDAYAYTKALGERALQETKGSVPVSIVRPSIIESALAEPVPGWIRGFRMAEPIIVSYARGLLKEFPGVPEGVIDVIPVDMVVAAIIAVAAAGPDLTTDVPAVYQVASGSRRPLRYRQLVDNVRDWFTEHPTYDSDGSPVMVPEWNFPGRGRVEQQLDRATNNLKRAERIISVLPVRGSRAEFAAKLEEKRAQAERAQGYVALYGAYTETEAIFQVDRLIALFERMPAEDQRAFLFDPAVIDWDQYVREVHLPSVVRNARMKMSPGKSKTASRAERGRKAVLSPDRHVAAFDLENTLIASNVVESFGFLATRDMSAMERTRFVADMFRQAPSMLKLDRKDRGDFLRSFYRRYEDAPAALVKEDAWEYLSQLVITKSFPAGIRRVREHRALGHRTILITGALDFLVEPLRPLFDEIVAANMIERPNGTFSGELNVSPPTGEARALILAQYCEAEGLSLEETVSYADSASDLPMLEIAGHPVAVNPEPKLATIARKRGWHVENWEKAPGGPRPLLPIGPLNPTRILGPNSFSRRSR